MLSSHAMAAWLPQSGPFPLTGQVARIDGQVLTTGRMFVARAKLRIAPLADFHFVGTVFGYSSS